MSKLLDNFRERMKDFSTEEMVNLYYEYLEKIQIANNEKNFKDLIQYSMISLPLIESLIIQTKNDFGDFVIKEIPAIEFVLSHYAIMDLRGHILNIKEIVDYFPELSKWQRLTDKAILMNKISKTILGHIKKYPDILQKNLKKLYSDIDSSVFSNICYLLELHKKIKRERVGNTYKLNISA